MNTFQIVWFNTHILTQLQRAQSIMNRACILCCKCNLYIMPETHVTQMSAGTSFIHSFLMHSPLGWAWRHDGTILLRWSWVFRPITSYGHLRQSVFSLQLCTEQETRQRFPGFLCSCHSLPRPRHPGRVLTFFTCAHKSCYGSSVFVSEMNSHNRDGAVGKERILQWSKHTTREHTSSGTTWPQPPLFCSFTPCYRRRFTLPLPLWPFSTLLSPSEMLSIIF